MLEDEADVAAESAWLGLLALTKALERRFRGISEEAHDELLSEAAVADVVRLRGKREERALAAAAEDAARRFGEIAVVARTRSRKKARHG